MITTNKQASLIRAAWDRSGGTSLLNRGPCLYCGCTEFMPFVKTANGNIVRCRGCYELGDAEVGPDAAIHIDHLENPKAYDPRWPQDQPPLRPPHYKREVK